MGVAAVIGLVGAAISAGAQVQEGNERKDWADYQAEQMRADAEAERGMAQVQASRIRTAADQQRSRVRASMAAGGMDVDGTGTPTIVDSSIAAGAEHDAFLALIGGQDAYARGAQQASAISKQGSKAKTAGYVGAGTTMLSAAGSMYGSGNVGWQGGRQSSKRTTTSGTPSINNYG